MPAAHCPVDLPDVFNAHCVMEAGKTGVLNQGSEIRLAVTVTRQPGSVFKAGSRVLKKGEPAHPLIFSDSTDNRHGRTVNAGFTGSVPGFRFNLLSDSSSRRHSVVAITRSGNIVRVDGRDPMVDAIT